MSLNTLAYPHEEAAGRRRLIDAALKLGAEKRGIASLGLRDWPWSPLTKWAMNCAAP